MEDLKFNYLLRFIIHIAVIAICIVILVSCGVTQPGYLYKQETYTVTKVTKFYCVAESENNKLRVRNFEINEGDTLISMEQIPVLKY